MSRSAHALAVLLAAGAINAGARADMFKPGIKDQIELGKRAAKQIAEKEKVLKSEDARVVEVRKIGEKLVSLIPATERKKKPFPFTFDVIDSKELNAFALPGGPIYIYSGLLDKLTTEDEVVGVLAHELTHIRNEHWASAYADTVKRQLGITVLLSVLGANDTAFKIADVTDTLLFDLPYSRKHESEADKVGYDLLCTAGYNPKGMIDVFEVLMKQSGNGKSGEWASDHPALGNRIDAIKKRMAKDNKTFPEERPRKK